MGLLGLGVFFVVVIVGDFVFRKLVGDFLFFFCVGFWVVSSRRSGGGGGVGCGLGLIDESIVAPFVFFIVVVSVSSSQAFHNGYERRNGGLRRVFVRV